MPDFGVFTNAVPALRAVWQRELVEASPLGALYNIVDSAGATERTRGLGALADVPEYNGTIEYDFDNPLDLKTFTHKEYAKGVAFGRAEADDMEYGVMASRVANLTIAVNRTIGNHMASPFINAFATTGDGAGAADAKALCATGRNSGKAVLNNKGTTALSADAVKATRKLMRNFKDERGNVLNVMPDVLIVPTDLEDEAIVITESLQVPGNANNDINTTRNLNVIVDPFLTDASDWFLVDSRLARLHLRWFWRVRPELQTDPTSDFSLQMRMRAYMRYSWGADAAHWIYGHEVA